MNVYSLKEWNHFNIFSLQVLVNKTASYVENYLFEMFIHSKNENEKVEMRK